MTAAGILAVRAVNQYRRRDVLAYLGLRYYLANSAARTDQWANEVAPSLVLRRANPAYLVVQHFKDVDARGVVAHRELFLPGPNEALAEAALLAACAESGGAFVPDNSVFSYRLATGSDVSGVYQHYMHGLRARHVAIANACKQAPEAKVVFLDLRRFYPSIDIRRARSVWTDACAESALPVPWIDLGLRLLDEHGLASGAARGHLLTGPMFSHLIGNLMLRRIDQQMSACPGRYFRYVDDIALVGSASEIEASLLVLRSQLDEIDLQLHDQNSSKSLTVTAQTWLNSERDYEEQKGGVSWMTFIGDLKRLLLTNPQLRGALVDALAGEGFRIPVPDYSAAVGERTYRERLAFLFRTDWFRRRVRAPSIQSVMAMAFALRDAYGREALVLLDGLERADTFQSKRLLPKLRYRFGRLAYLGDDSQLANLASASANVSALRFHSAVAGAIATGDVGGVIGYGVNAAQAAAQPLRMQSRRCFIGESSKLTGAEQSLAVLNLNGLKIDFPASDPVANELLAFAVSGSNSDLMRSGDPFIRELACLHGISDHPRHQQTLDTAFDHGEDIALDAIEQDHQSS